jgi:hypothetical protein
VSIAVILTTGALGERSSDIVSSGGIKHKERLRILQDVLLPRLQASPLVDEIIVAGEWHEPGLGDRWRYVPCASQNFDCTDALAKRQTGAEATTSRLLLFLHDDHVPAEDFFLTLQRKYANDPTWDVLVPERRTFKDGQEIVLNSGRGDYVMGHACVMRRAMWKDVPWTDVPQVFTWDVGHTILLQQKLAKIRWCNDLIVYDAEAALGSEPWTGADVTIEEIVEGAETIISGYGGEFQKGDILKVGNREVVRRCRVTAIAYDKTVVNKWKAKVEFLPEEGK